MYVLNKCCSFFGEDYMYMSNGSPTGTVKGDSVLVVCIFVISCVCVCVCVCVRARACLSIHLIAITGISCFLPLGGEICVNELIIIIMEMMMMTVFDSFGFNSYRNK